MGRPRTVRVGLDLDPTRARLQILHGLGAMVVATMGERERRQGEGVVTAWLAWVGSGRISVSASGAWLGRNHPRQRQEWQPGLPKGVRWVVLRVGWSRGAG